jgi:hypothetical protein
MMRRDPSSTRREASNASAIRDSRSVQRLVMTVKRETVAR